MKKCPYCAEFIQDEAIVCRYCGRELDSIPLPKKELTRRNWVLLIVLFFALICILGIFSRNFSTWISAPQLQPTVKPEMNLAPDKYSDLCDWYIATQFLRAERIGGLTEFNDWYSKYGEERFDFTNSTSLGELAQIMSRYRSYQTEFLDDWGKLGSHPDAKIFWQKEYESVQLRLQSFDLLTDGINTRDEFKFNSGLDLLYESSQTGREGESEMVKLVSECYP